MEIEIIGGANSVVAEVGLDSDVTAVALDDSFAQREADTSSVVLVLAVKALEHLEHLVGMLRVDADSLVTDRDHPLVAVVRLLQIIKNILKDWHLGTISD